MRKENIKNIILAVLFVILFVFILVEANKSNKGYQLFNNDIKMLYQIKDINIVIMRHTN